MTLIEPTPKFVEYVYLSSHYLNCPKHILNHTLDCFYRQFYDNHDKAVNAIADTLKKYQFTKPIETAKQFVFERSQTKMAEFDELNVNAYIDKTPDHIQKRNEYLNRWYMANTKQEWRHGYLISEHTPTYPYKTL